MDLSFFKWIFALLTVVVIIKSTVIIYYVKITTRTVYGIPSAHCVELRHKFSNITSALPQIDIQNITEDLLTLMSCSPIFNVTQKELNRVRLRACCNATGVLYLTKQNTAVNQSIPYETSSKQSYKINPALHNMLPEDFPWSGHVLDQCAVVGSGGILKNSSCGKEIDSADYVIRFNMAPINNSDVGLKTDLLTINPSQLRRYKNISANPDPLLQRVSVYGNASLIIPAFAYSYDTQLAINTLQMLRPIRPHQWVVFFTSNYLKKLTVFWRKSGLTGKRLSTGFMLISTALEVCDHVHVYGFWPFDINLQHQQLPHHYFDNIGPKLGVHSMPKEFLHLLQLHSQGALTMHLQPCS